MIITYYLVGLIMAAIKKANKAKNNGSGQVSVSQEIEESNRKLDSELKAIRKKAMVSLASAGEPRIIVLIKTFEDIHYFSVRPEFIKTLGSIGKSAVKPLMEMLVNKTTFANAAYVLVSKNHFSLE